VTPSDRPPSSPRDAAGPLRTSRPLQVRRLGLVPYADGLELQRRLVEERKADRIPDTLLLLQHPAVLTIGVKKDGRDHILASPDRLAALGVDVFETGRGGDVTYHGPGQLVGYPIVNLDPDRRDVHKYVRDLEEVMIRVCADYGLEAGRVKGFSGAWIGDQKIGAIGVRISRWITSHGFAFNVTTDLDFFNLIVPCGIADKGVTSLQSKLGRTVEIRDVEDHFLTHFTAVLDRKIVAPPAPSTV
jgi:lipoyl(octanoyl) transferase